MTRAARGCSLLLALGIGIAGCGDARREASPPPGGAPSGAPVTETRSETPPGKPSVEVRATNTDEQRASVEEVLAARHIRPGERLAVRLLGTIGPNGSWGLDTLAVRREADRVVVEPRVRRVAGDAFIQMVIPLDQTVALDLPAGTHRIEVLGRDSVRAMTVEVTDAAARPPVEVRVLQNAPIAAEGDEMLPMRVVATVADGFVDRIEVRETIAGKVSEWRAPDFVERTGSGLAATVTLRRPAGDPERRFEARAVDGQGAEGSSEVALPGR